MPPLMPAHASRRQAQVGMVILRVAAAAVARGEPVDQTLSGIFRQHHEFGSRDRRFFSTLVFAWFRWRGWLEHPEAPTEADAVTAFLLDAREVPVALAALAERAEGSPPPEKSGSFPAISHRLVTPMGALSLTQKAAVLSDWFPGHAFPATALVPAWLAATVHVPAGEDRGAWLARCVEAFQVRPPTWIRLRGAGGEGSLVIGQRSEGSGGGEGKGETSNVEMKPGNGSPNLPHDSRFTIHNSHLPSPVLSLPPGTDVEGEIARLKGRGEVQDLASQCVGWVCDPRPGEQWWDVCAGSGGKSLHLADLMRDQGGILATDIRDTILRQLRERCRRSGVRSITAAPWAGETDPAPGRLFDGVLVDAPCSGIGTWHRNPDARWRLTADDVAALARRQAALLDAAARKVRPGGCLVYATCTLTDIENSSMIEAFRGRHPEFQAAPVRHPLTRETAGDGAIWIWPWQGPCNGMYVARLVRAG